MDSLRKMRPLLQLQDEEAGSLLAYLDKFHYPMWITQFYENIVHVTQEIIKDAYGQGVRLLELRYSPAIHTFAGLTLRQAIRAVLSGMNRARRKYPDLELGLVVISMRQHGPHIAKIIARQAIAEAQHLHRRCGVVGFDLAGAEKGNPPHLFREAYEIARKGGLGLTVHAGEDEGPERIWEAIDELGADRIGHGCSAVHDAALMRRLASDRIEKMDVSTRQTGWMFAREFRDFNARHVAGVDRRIPFSAQEHSAFSQLRQRGQSPMEIVHCPFEDNLGIGRQGSSIDGGNKQ